LQQKKIVVIVPTTCRNF